MEVGAPRSLKFVEDSIARGGSVKAAVTGVSYIPHPEALLLMVSLELFAQVGEIRLRVS